MVAQRWPDEPDEDDSGYDPDPRSPAMPARARPRGDAAAMVRMAARDGTGVHLRRRSRFVEAARPNRPQPASGRPPRPAPQTAPRFSLGLSRLAGTGLAVLVVAGLVFTVIRSGNDAGPELFDRPAVAVPGTAVGEQASATSVTSATSVAPAGVPAAAASADPPPAPTSLDRLLPPVTAPSDAAGADDAPSSGSGADDTAGEPAGAGFAAEVPPVARPAEPSSTAFAGYDLPDALTNWPFIEVYVVQPGDLLGNVALENRTTSNAIAGLNGITDTSHLRAGERLQIPVGYVEPVVLPAVDPVAALHGWLRMADYTVRDGDSIAAIAELFLTTPAAVMFLNDLAPGVVPSAGTTLRIPWGFTLDVGGVGPAAGS